MVIGEITTEKPFEMAFAQGDGVIQTLPADATNDAFDIGILPRAPRCDGAVFHSQTVHAFSKAISKDSIAIPPALKLSRILTTLSPGSDNKSTWACNLRLIRKEIFLQVIP